MYFKIHCSHLHGSFHCLTSTTGDYSELLNTFHYQIYLHVTKIMKNQVKQRSLFENFQIKNISSPEG